MAGKTEVTPQKHESSERDAHDSPSDGPLLDLSDAAIKKLREEMGDMQQWLATNLGNIMSAGGST